MADIQTYEFAIARLQRDMAETKLALIKELLGDGDINTIYTLASRLSRLAYQEQDARDHARDTERNND